MPSRSDRAVPRRRTADDSGVHINFITRAEVNGEGQIKVWTRGTAQPRTFDALPGRAGVQLTTALLAHLHINGGTWTSVATLRGHHWSSMRLLAWLDREHGIDDLTDPGFTPTLAWEAVLAVNRGSGQQRNCRTFLAETLSGLRPDGETHRSALYGRAVPAEMHQVQGYSPEVADCIEQVARAHVGDWFLRHRKAVQVVLGDLPRDWLHLPAGHLIAASGGAIPEGFDVGVPDLAAAMVLLALVDDKGPNLSVIQSYTGDSLERAGDDAAFATGVKARNRSVVRSPAPSGGLFSYGGLLEFVTAATRVARHERDDGSDFARLLFVASDQQAVMNGQQVNSWWATTAWPDPSIPRPTRLSFRRLRKAARLRGERHGRVLIGQGSQTARLYLADAVPDVILVPGLLGVQNSVTEYWRSQMVPVEAEQAEAVEELSTTEDVMDVGVAMCASGGKSPTDQNKACGLGPVACFVCPNGYRTPEVIPGLLAAVQFTEGIRKHEPTEWLSGEAPVLNTLARKALDQFPAPVVSAASEEDVHNARALIACVYLEGRRRD